MARTARGDPYADALRFDLMTFAERCFRELKPTERFETAPYLEYLAAKLQACLRGEIRRLIICLPPRHLKSILASVALPAFILGHDPTRSVMCVSYGQELSDTLARDCRRIMRSGWYETLFPNTRLPRTVINDLGTSAGGYRLGTSVGGVVTGRGADFVIIDDPLKPEEALSESRRTFANEWIDNTLMSRLNNQQTGVIIVVMQRLHLDDVAGHLLAKGGWEMVSLPAIAEDDERYEIQGPLGRVSFRRDKGEALHPARIGLQRYREIRFEVGPYNFASQYQQNPIPLEGNLVKRRWLPRFDLAHPPTFTGIVQSWDTANKAGELNDFSVCTTWGVRDRHYYLLDVLRRRLEFPDLKRAVKELRERLDANTVLIEDKASGTQLIQELQREGVYGIKAVDPPPQTDKIIRLHMHTATIEAGRLLVPHDAPWLDDYLTELTGFPGLRHDDQVDSTTQALAFFAGGDSLGVWYRLGD